MAGISDVGLAQPYNILQSNAGEWQGHAIKNAMMGEQVIGQQMENQLNAQKMQQQNAMLQSLQSPLNFNQETGRLNATGLNSISRHNPKLAAEIGHQYSLADQEAEKAKLNKIQGFLATNKIGEEESLAIYDSGFRMKQAYDLAKEKWGEEAATRYVNEKLMPGETESLAKRVRPDVMSKLSRTFNPTDADVALRATKGWAQHLAEQKLVNSETSALQSNVAAEGLVPGTPEFQARVRELQNMQKTPAAIIAATTVTPGGMNVTGWGDPKVTDDGVIFQTNNNSGQIRVKDPDTGEWKLDKMPKKMETAHALGTAPASVAITKQDQVRLDKLPTEYKISQYARGAESAERVESQLTDPKQGYISITPAQARGVVEQAKLMMSGYRPWGGGKYQDEQVGKMNGLLDRAAKWVETWGTGDSILAKDRMLELTREMKNIYADQNAAMLRDELNIAQKTDDKGGKRSSLTTRGKVDDVVKSGRGYIQNIGGIDYLVFKKRGDDFTKEDVYPLK